MRFAFVLVALVVAACAAPSVKKPFASTDFDRYWSLQEIYDYMDELSESRPDITETAVFGGTHEGRAIRGIRIASEAHLEREQLPIIFVTGGVTARDWITSMAAISLIHELIAHYDDFRGIVDDVEWFIIPVVNPDGYEFSRLNAANRAWIKNRRVIQGSTCFGVNVDRNFDFNFGLEISSSSEPCSSNFRGPAADSEEETKTVQFAVDITQRWQKAYITLKAGSVAAHSMVSFPFSSNNELFMPNFRERMNVANIATNAIWQQTGARYRSSSEAAVNGFISGTSGDYAAGRDNIPLVYSMFARAAGNNGWDVPETEIVSVIGELFAGIVAIAEYVHTMPLPPPMD